MFHPRASDLRSVWVEPFWIFSMACYAVHRLWQWTQPSPEWMSNHWNDIWMLPCAVPLVIRIYITLDLRKSCAPPGLSEIVWLGLLWSVMAEGVAPIWLTGSTADPMDVLAYALGGFMLWLRWHLVPRLNHGLTLGLR